MLSRRAKKGNAVILISGAMVVGLMMSSIGIDMGFMYAERELLQSAADAGVLSGTHQLVRNTSNDPNVVQGDVITNAVNIVAEHTVGDSNIVAADPNQDITLGYIDPNNPVYNRNTFTNPSNNPAYGFSGGYNAVSVVVRRTADSPGGAIPSLMANLFGVNQMESQASSVAMMDNSVSQVISGLRPFYGCQAQFDLAYQDGDPTNNIARIYGKKQTLDGKSVNGCPKAPAGNWGFADLRDGCPGAPGNRTLARWIKDGFGTSYGERPVIVGRDYSTQPGNSISSKKVRTAIQQLIDDQTVIMIPLTDHVSGSGSNAHVDVSQIAGFVITDFKYNGPSKKRYIEGYYTKAVCSNNCVAGTGNGNGGSVFKLRLVR